MVNADLPQERRDFAEQAVKQGITMVEGIAQHKESLWRHARQLSASVGFAEAPTIDPQDPKSLLGSQEWEQTRNQLMSAGAIQPLQRRVPADGFLDGLTQLLTKRETEPVTEIGDGEWGGIAFAGTGQTPYGDPGSRYLIPREIANTRLWTTAKEARKLLRRAQIAEGELVERDGRRFVKTEDFGDVELPKLKNIIGAKSGFEGALGELVFAPEAVEKGEFLFGDIFHDRTEEEKEGGYPSLIGNFKYLPKFTGNKIRDEAMLLDPTVMRAIQESDEGRFLLPGARALAGTADFLLVDLATRKTLRGLGAGTRASSKLLRQSAYVDRMTKQFRFPAQVAAGVRDALLRGQRGTLANPRMRIPQNFDLIDVGREVYYGSINALAAGRPVSEGFQEGLFEGTFELGLGIPARGLKLATRGAIHKWRKSAPSFMRRWHFESMLPDEFAREAGVEAAGKLARRAESEAFTDFVARYRTTVENAVGKRFKSIATRKLFFNIFDSTFVGLGFGALEAANVEAMRETGKPLSALGIKDQLGYWMSNWFSPESIAQATAYSFGVGATSGAHRWVKFTPEQQRHISDLAETAMSMLENATPEERAGAMNAFLQRVKDDGMGKALKELRTTLGPDPRIDTSEKDWAKMGVAELAGWMDLEGGFDQVLDDVIDAVSDETLVRLEGEIRALPDLGPVRPDGRTKVDPNVVALRQAIEREQIYRRETGTQVPLEEVAGPTAEQRPDLAPLGGTSEDYQRSGFSHPQHAVRAVKKHLGKDYATLSEIPKAELEEASRLSESARAGREKKGPSASEGAKKADEATRRAKQRSRKAQKRRLEAKGVPISDDPPTFGEIQGAVEQVYEALRTHPDYAGLDREEVIERAVPNKAFGDRLLLADAVLAARELAGAVPAPKVSAKKAGEKKSAAIPRLDRAAEIASQALREYEETFGRSWEPRSFEEWAYTEEALKKGLDYGLIGGAELPGNLAWMVRRFVELSGLPPPRDLMSAIEQVESAAQKTEHPDLLPGSTGMETPALGKMLGATTGSIETGLEDPDLGAFAQELLAWEPLTIEVAEHFTAFLRENFASGIPEPASSKTVLEIPKEARSLYEAGARIFSREKHEHSVTSFQRALAEIYIAAGEGRESDIDFFISGFLVSYGMDADYFALLQALGINTERINTVRNRLIELGRPALPALNKRLMEITDPNGERFLSEQQLMDPRLQDDLAVASLGYDRVLRGRPTEWTGKTIISSLKPEKKVGPRWSGLLDAPPKYFLKYGIKEEQVNEFKAALQELEPGLRKVAGRFVRGDAEKSRGKKIDGPVARLAKKISQAKFGVPQKFSHIIEMVDRTPLELANDFFNLAAGIEMPYDPAGGSTINWSELIKMSEAHSTLALEVMASAYMVDLSLDDPSAGRESEATLRELALLANEDADTLKLIWNAVNPETNEMVFKTEEDAQAAITAAVENAKKARQLAQEAYVAVSEEVGGEAGRQEAKDLLEAMDLEGRGEVLSGPLAERLLLIGFAEGTEGGARLKEGAYEQLNRDFKDAIYQALEKRGAESIKRGDFEHGRVLLFAMDPITMLAGRPGKDMWKWPSRISLARFVEYLVENKSDSRMARAFVKLAEPWYRYVGRPQRSAFAPRSVRLKAMQFRRLRQDAEGRLEAFRQKLTEILDLMDREGLTVEMRELAAVAIESGMHYRAKSPEDYVKAFGVSIGSARKLMDVTEKSVDLMNSIGQRMVNEGMLDVKAFRRLKGRFIAHVEKQGEKSFEQIIREYETSAWGGSGREMGRDTQAPMSAARRELDLGLVLPASANIEARRVQLFEAVRGMVETGLTEKQFHELSPIERRFYERAALPVGRGEARSKIHQNLLWDWASSQEQSMDGGQTASTDEKRYLMSSVKTKYVLKSANQEIAMLLRAFEPQAPGVGGIMDEVGHFITHWRSVNTLQNPVHWHLNIRNSFITNALTGKVRLQDAVTGWLTGRGHYSNAMMHIADFQEWNEGTGSFSDAGPRSDLDLADPDTAENVRKVQQFMDAAGMSTFVNTIIRPTSMRDSINAWLGRAKALPTGEEGLDFGMATAELTSALGEYQRKVDRYLGEMLGSRDPRGQAEGLRALSSQYQMVEVFFKYAAALSLEAQGTNKPFRDIVESAMEGTADYGDRNPYLHQFTTDFYLHHGAKTAEIRAIRKEARKAGQLETRDIPQGVSRFARLFFSSPFLSYQHQMIPAMAHALVFNPTRVAAYSSLVWMFHSIISQLMGGDEEEIENALAGTAEWLNKNIVIEPDAFKEFENAYGDVPWGSFTGVDATGLIESKPSSAFTGVMKEIQEPGFFISRAPSRGMRSRYTTWVEDLRPISWLSAGTNFVTGVTSSHVPYQWNTALDDLVGLLPGMAFGSAAQVATAAMGKKGRGFTEIAVGAAGDTAREIFGAMGPQALLSRQGQRLFEEALLDGQDVLDVMAGIEKPGVRESDLWTRGGGFLYESIVNTRRTPSGPVIRYDKGSVGQQIARIVTAGKFDNMRPAEKRELEREYGIVHNRFSRQVNDIVRDTYEMWRRERWGYHSLDRALANGLNLFSDLDDQGELVQRPQTELGKFIARQPEEEQFRYIRTAQLYFKNAQVHEARKTLASLMRTRSIDGSLVSRLWGALEDPKTKDLGLDFIYRRVHLEKDYENLDVYAALFDDIFKQLGENANREKREKILEAFSTQGVRKRALDPARIQEVVGAEGPDVFPRRFIEALMQASY
jgi:hypothetical protein